MPGFYFEFVFSDFRFGFYMFDSIRISNKMFDKKCTFGLPGGLVGVWVPQGRENRNFTHPIFESDFDCLTGKHRILALSLLPLLP